MSDLQTASELRATADYLRSKGWRQGSFGYDGGSRCLAGAWASACRDGNAEAIAASGRNAYGPLAEPLGLIRADGWAEISHWNDTPGRTLDEVLDRLESTALALEVRHLATESVSGNLAIPVTAETRDYAKVAT